MVQPASNEQSETKDKFRQRSAMLRYESVNVYKSLLN